MKTLIKEINKIVSTNKVFNIKMVAFNLTHIYRRDLHKFSFNDFEQYELCILNLIKRQISLLNK